MKAELLRPGAGNRLDYSKAPHVSIASCGKLAAQLVIG